MEYFVVYFLLFIGIILLSIGLFYTTKIKKQVAAIFINISLPGFVLFPLLIIGIISMYQDNFCDFHDRPCFILIKELGLNITSTMLFIIGLVSIYLYSKTILNWKASHES